MCIDDLGQEAGRDHRPQPLNREQGIRERRNRPRDLLIEALDQALHHP